MTAARVLVTGSRQWSDVAAVEGALTQAWDEALQAGFDGIVVVHGGCETGADRLAWEWAARVDVPVEVFMADWGRYGRAAGPRRNVEMVAAGADVALAFLAPDSRGTCHTVKLAQAAAIPLRIFREGAEG